MIFVITGSQKFQFNRLLNEIDKLLLDGVIEDKVFAQTGYSNYMPVMYEYRDFLSRSDFVTIMNESSIIITHGGTGAIIESVKKGKKVIAVPRLAEFNEHVDDHQVQLLRQFDSMNIICSCYRIENLRDCIMKIDNMSFSKYHSNTDTIIQDIEDFLSDSIKTK